MIERGREEGDIRIIWSERAGRLPVAILTAPSMAPMDEKA
jgi:hypothetical protein